MKDGHGVWRRGFIMAQMKVFVSMPFGCTRNIDSSSYESAG